MSGAKADDGGAGDRQSHARRNEAALLRAATAAIHREGLRVPLGTIADDAGVGIGTLYRHFSSRDRLLDELTHRSFARVLVNAREAEKATPHAVEALRLFIEAAIAQRNELILPLHGGPPLTSPATIDLQRKVHRIVQRLLERGRKEHGLAPDVTAREVVAFGAMLAQPHAPDPHWDDLCRRVLATYMDGLTSGGSARPSPTTAKATPRDAS